MDERGGSRDRARTFAPTRPGGRIPVSAWHRGVTLQSRSLEQPARAGAACRAPTRSAIALALRGPDSNGDTTNLGVVDRDGNAVVLTTSLGLGSGDWSSPRPASEQHGAGEADLLIGEAAPGERMASMMSPTIVTDADGLAVAVGAAGGTRLRSALVQAVAGLSTKA